MNKHDRNQRENNFKNKLHEIIFEADTLVGKIFDIALIIIILLSVLVVMLDSITSLKFQYGYWFYLAEWIFTIIFTIEYILRLYVVGQPRQYAFSFFGIIDFLAIIPTYLSLIFPGSQYLIVIRILRVLRIFRVLKLAKYIFEARILVTALRSSSRKIVVFIFSVLTLVVIFGSLMYLIEGAENGFTSIPRSIYWAIVTLTTVGYGDISPQTPMGQLLAVIIMILGYGIIAVPTGIVTSQIIRMDKKKFTTQVCKQCAREGHDPDAEFCKFCGAKL